MRIRFSDPVFGSGYESGDLGPDLWTIFKIPFNKICKSFFFVFLIFCVRRSIDAPDPENKPGSGSVKIRTGSGSRALRLTENVWHQKYENKKKGSENDLEFSFDSILNISYCSGYRALDPKFCQNRILIPVFIPLVTCFISFIVNITRHIFFNFILVQMHIQIVYKSLIYVLKPCIMYKDIKSITCKKKSIVHQPFEITRWYLYSCQVDCIIQT